jgi:hypothetical protein
MGERSWRAKEFLFFCKPLAFIRLQQIFSVLPGFGTGLATQNNEYPLIQVSIAKKLVIDPPKKIMKTTQSIARIVAICAATAGVTSAATLDLTTAGSSGFINGAYFTTADNHSTGTGVIEPFVRVQDNGIADGYNASVSSLMPDVKTGLWTHDIQLSAVPQVEISGVNYYEFLLDINQTKANPLLSLDKIQLYTRATALTEADDLGDLAGSMLRYDLDFGGDNTILMDYSLNEGSGSGDLFAYFPVSYFGASSDYLYFYSMFGETGEPYDENDGFEEWAVREPGTSTRVPDGGTTIALLGMALLGLGGVRKALGKF